MWLFTRRQLGPPHSLLNGVQQCNAACQHLQCEPDHWHTEHWSVRGREQTTICFPQPFLSYCSWDRPTTPFIIPTSLGLLPLSWVRHLHVNIVPLFSSKAALGGTEETDGNIQPPPFSLRMLFRHILKDIPSLNEYFHTWTPFFFSAGSPILHLNCENQMLCLVNL